MTDEYTLLLQVWCGRDLVSLESSLTADLSGCTRIRGLLSKDLIIDHFVYDVHTGRRIVLLAPIHLDSIPAGWRPIGSLGPLGSIGTCVPHYGDLVIDADGHYCLYLGDTLACSNGTSLEVGPFKTVTLPGGAAANFAEWIRPRTLEPPS